MLHIIIALLQGYPDAVIYNNVDSISSVQFELNVCYTFFISTGQLFLRFEDFLEF